MKAGLAIAKATTLGAVAASVSLSLLKTWLHFSQMPAMLLAFVIGVLTLVACIIVLGRLRF